MRRLKIELDGYHSTAVPAIRASDYINARVLAAGVEESETVPTGARIVLFSSTSNFYLKVGATAAVPSTDVTNGSGSELNPIARLVAAAEVLHLIAPTACIVTMAYYK